MVGQGCVEAPILKFEANKPLFRPIEVIETDIRLTQVVPKQGHRVRRLTQVLGNSPRVMILLAEPNFPPW